MDTDKELMASFQGGDKDAFERLIIKYRHKAISFSQRFIHDPFMAEDIVQDAFAYIYVYKDKYNSKYSFKTYLFTIIRNKSIDYIRKKRDTPLYDDKSLISKGEALEDTIIKRDKANCVNRNLNKLKEDYKTAIHLIDYESFSYKEAAKIMGKSNAGIKVLIYRARKKLKSLIEKEGYLNV
ncbi:RNA polymerase sigma factor [Maledivibacter halophilus]|uniref:RNA polymerase sigma factor n=1 Tax=Maledivibacter halophilus TaxID=36842 RepID=A0A1T5MK00_9FIRM|nr:RNA polymerase sigma factor [Maledivibacter halophilus]SKC88274.1 RNA polymerase sigma-70 factor, ECF subfamily [Maledivibacter halophilus]